MSPRKKDQTLEQYAQLVTVDLIARAQGALNSRGPHAAWEIIFNAICDEGQYVRDAGPAALVVYQKYIAVAAAFLRDHPDSQRIFDLRRRAVNDVEHLSVSLKFIKRTSFELEEYTAVYEAMGVIQDMLVSLR